MDKPLPRVVVPLLVSLCGCYPAALPVTGPVRPNPNIDLPQSSVRLAFELADDIPERVDADGCMARFRGTPERYGAHCEEVLWRSELAVGFEQGLAPFFVRERDPASADETLQIVAADLKAAETPVFRGAPAVQFVLRYRAHLLDRSGRILGRSFGTVASQPGFDADNAVEVMYETIARDLFVGPPGRQ